MDKVEDLINEETRTVLSAGEIVSGMRDNSVSDMAFIYVQSSKSPRDIVPVRAMQVNETGDIILITD